jgi:hypothetical protein
MCGGNYPAGVTGAEFAGENWQQRHCAECHYYAPARITHGMCLMEAVKFDEVVCREVRFNREACPEFEEAYNTEFDCED